MEWGKLFPPKHMKIQRERQRNRLGCKRRYYGAKSYRSKSNDAGD